ncbi:hypothetical protein LCGC14_0714380 [marine sediment metagenome]|uniref:N-methyl-D-aspartate receptor NMDAR2C subunit n=1 Tax=marine sediment metagenome TaxID=412755 RepID=A0A0F9QIL7_9ZZZZ
MKKVYLRNDWINLTSKYSDNEELIVDMFNLIEKCYNSSFRYYHNLSHIENMLSESENFRTNVSDYDSIIFAIWFHDIVYNVKKSDNEIKSAVIAEDFLNSINYDKIKLDKIKVLILKTKNHSLFDSNEDFDTKLFLDLDLLILGANNRLYRKYAENIRKEYSFVPDKIFNTERIKILEDFLNQEFTFRTERFRKRYENIARKNIKSEINFLSKV